MSTNLKCWTAHKQLLIALINVIIGVSLLVTGCDSSSSAMGEGSQIDELGDLDPMEESDSGMNDHDSSDQMAMDATVPEEITDAPRGRLIAGIIGRGHWDGPGEQARFDGMVCATLSSEGERLYITDSFSGTVRSVDLETNEVSTLGGFPYEFAVFDGPLDQARFESPRGCGVAPNDEGVLIADSATLRWVNASEAEVTTWTGRSGDTGNRDGSSSDARLGYLTHDLIWAPSGAYALISDRSNDRIRIFVRETRTLHALAPLREGEGAITLSGPGGLALTDDGDLLVADTFNGRLVRVELSDLNLEQRINAGAQAGDAFTFDFDTVEAEVISDTLSDPQGVATSGDRAWAAGFNGALIEIDLMTGDTTPVALNLSLNKEPPLGGLFAPMVFDPWRDVLYYLDINSESLRQIKIETGVVRTIAGPKDPVGDRDGTLTTARFGILYDVVATEQGWIVADPEYGKVKRVITEGDDAGVTTLISARANPRLRLPPELIVGDSPVALAYDVDRAHLYIADIRQHVIRRYDLNTKAIEVVIGAVDELGAQDGVGVEARLNEPFGLDFGADGLLYVCDVGNQSIRSYNPETQEVLTVAQGELEPFDVLLHSDGYLYVVDGNTPVVYKLVEGQFEPIVGNTMEMGPGDGTDGRFATPIALSRYDERHFMVIDAENHRVRLVDPEQQTIDTWVGHFTRHGGVGTREPLPWADLRLQSPNAVARDGDAAIVLSDTGLILLEGDPRALEE